MLQSSLSTLPEAPGVTQAVEKDWTATAEATAVNCLIIGQDVNGLWIVRDRFGLRAGIFRALAPALRFAKEEARAGNYSLVSTAGPIDLDVDRQNGT